MVPQRHGIMDDFQLLHHVGGDFRPRALRLERHHAGEIPHLPQCQRVLRVRRKTGVKHLAHGRVLLQEAGDLQRRLLVRPHADGQRRRAPQDQPGIEGRQHTAEMHRCLEVERSQFRLASDHRAAHGIAMAADVLGQRMHHEIGAQLQRLGGDRGGIGRIHGHVPHPLLVRQP